MRPAPSPGALHPHVAALQGLVGTVAWCLATPVALWLACGVLAPVGFALAGHADALRAQLLGIALSEQAQARLATPALTLPGWGDTAAAWPWECSAAACATIFPQDTEQPPAQATHRRPDLVTMLKRAAERPWQGARTVQRLLACIACTRGWYGLGVLLGLLPFLGMCWFLGVPTRTPQARRARWWLLLLRQALAGIAAVCALPILIATMPVMFALVVLAGGALAMLRRQSPG